MILLPAGAVLAGGPAPRRDCGPAFQRGCPCRLMPRLLGPDALELRDLTVSYGAHDGRCPTLPCASRPGRCSPSSGPPAPESPRSCTRSPGSCARAPARSGCAGTPGGVAGSGAEPPERRDVAMVFQNYALWPHLTALDTVAYPMRRRGVPGGEARRDALEILARLHIADLATGTRRSCRGRAAAGGAGPRPGSARVAVPVRRADRAPGHARPRGLPRGAARPGGGTAERPRCTRPTTPRRRSGWRTGLPCSPRGAWSRSARPRRSTNDRSTCGRPG